MYIIIKYTSKNVNCFLKK